MKTHEIIDSTVVMGNAAVGKVDDNVALLVLFGSVHCALIAETAFVQSYYANNRIPARNSPSRNRHRLVRPAECLHSPPWTPNSSTFSSTRCVTVYRQRPLKAAFEACVSQTTTSHGLLGVSALAPF